MPGSMQREGWIGEKQRWKMNISQCKKILVNTVLNLMHPFKQQTLIKMSLKDDHHLYVPMN